MGKRFEVHIATVVWQKLVAIARRKGLQTKRMTKKVMARALWDFVQREDSDV